MKVIVAIPTYNCAAQLPRVLDALTGRFPAAVSAVWVVDNGSSDGTREIALAYAETHEALNLHVFRNRSNVNLGGTHKNVFRAAAADGATHVVILHGDDQARGDEVAGLIDESVKHGGTSILGSRFARGATLLGYDWKRIAGNRVLNVIYSVLTLRHLTDLGSGLNLFALAQLEEGTYMSFGNKLSFNYELTLDLVRRRIQFRYLPITWSESDQVTNARNVNIFLEALKIVGRWRIGLATTPAAETDTEYGWQELSR